MRVVGELHAVQSDMSTRVTEQIEGPTEAFGESQSWAEKGYTSEYFDRRRRESQQAPGASAAGGGGSSAAGGGTNSGSGSGSGAGSGSTRRPRK